MSRALLVWMGLVVSLKAVPPQFIDINAGLPGIADCSVAWGDHDNDGDLDVLLAGNIGPGQNICRIYRNNGNGTFTDINAGLRGIADCSVAWGDYDNDGDLDVLLAGYDGSGGISRIYRNNGNGTFAYIEAELPGIIAGCSVAWGDYDNDGNLDVLLAGYIEDAAAICQIYRNNGNGTFAAIEAELPGIYHGSVAWGDYDNDGDLDVLLAGSGICRIYRNNGNGTFTDINAGLPDIYYSSVAWGDYDNDGDLDVLLAGSTGFANICRTYRNNGNGTFAYIEAELPGIYHGSVAWGDYDNDGDLDVLLAGYDGSGDICRIYENTGSSIDSPPNAPSNLAVSSSGNTVHLFWTAASDAQTPANGLTYNLRVGTTAGGTQTVPAHANPATGLRRVAALGNQQHGLSARLNVTDLPGGIFYWSVQAIDTAFAGGPFASESAFSHRGRPTAIWLPPTPLPGQTTATLRGTANPGGVAAKYWFEYSPSLAFDNATPVSSLAEGLLPVNVTAPITGLRSNYHYYARLVVSNSFGVHTTTNEFFTVGPRGYALCLDGQDDYVEVTPSTGSDFNFPPPGLSSRRFTLEGWFKINSFTANNQALLTKGNSGAWRLQRNGTNGSLDFDITGPSPQHLPGARIVHDGRWHHVAAIYTGSQKLLYIDGTLDAWATVTGSMTTNSHAVHIGDNSQVSGRNFNGWIDEVRIWKTNRTETQIQQNMFGQIQVTSAIRATLLAYYRFDEGSGKFAYDISHTNDATLVGPVRVVSTALPRFIFLDASRQPDGQTRLGYYGLPDFTYTLQSTPALANPPSATVWSVVDSLAPDGFGPWEVLDTGSVGQPRRFYRGVSP